eukprot:TRINITY_DN106232_c0_g1_i1.p1 TRINITY_DN106232_c0_g1~~TRINITY_DN106232_c0_g1_i1.p1  ORF type:complete len:1060 (-),score=244.56 TRINITY_DN106232_c0_g1_i1:60-3239(-)
MASEGDNNEPGPDAGGGQGGEPASVETPQVAEATPEQVAEASGGPPPTTTVPPTEAEPERAMSETEALARGNKRWSELARLQEEQEQQGTAEAANQAAIGAEPAAEAVPAAAEEALGKPMTDSEALASADNRWSVKADMQDDYEFPLLEDEEAELMANKPAEAVAEKPLEGNPLVEHLAAAAPASPSEAAPADPNGEVEEKPQLKVSQKIYLGWVRNELDKEAACLELPFTILLLISFAMMAIFALNQHLVYAIEQAIEKDIVENANFAFSGYMGEKNLHDVHSFADFWSWVRLGFLPLVIKPTWSYSESRTDDVASVFDLSYAASPLSEAPSSWVLGAFAKDSGSSLPDPVPMTGDYLRYNRIIGGLRFRQQVALAASYDLCKWPDTASRAAYESWSAKPCMPAYEELPYEPDTSQGEVFVNPERVEWLLIKLDSFDRMIDQLVDSEDGCAQMAAKNRTEDCYCIHCSKTTPASPWLDERTQRIEVGMATYNPEYGLLTLTGVNFWFARGGRVEKRVELMSLWVDFSMPSVPNIPLLVCEAVWILSLFYIACNELKEICSIMRNAEHSCVRSLQDEYLGIWNIIDWISIVLACVVLYFGADLLVNIMALAEGMQTIIQLDPTSLSRADYTKMVDSFYDDVESVCAIEKIFRLSLGIYPNMLMLRLFKSFAAQPRLAVVTDTIKMASQDMLHFGIVLLAVVCSLTLCSVLLFGRDLEAFGDFGRATHSCFRMMFGDWDLDDMEDVTRTSTYVWFTLFLSLVVIILLNMLLAIIMDNYMAVKKRSSSAQSLAAQIQEMRRRRRMLRNKERVRLNDIWDAFVGEANGDERAASRSERELTAEIIQDTVSGIPFSQAERTLKNSWKEHLKATTVPFELEHSKEWLQRLEQETRIVRNALYFIYDRVFFYDTRQSTNPLVAEALAKKEAEAMAASAKTKGELQETTVDQVSTEMERLSAEAAERLASLLAGIDTRQGRIEEKQEMIASMTREMTAGLLTMQNQASHISSRLEGLNWKKRKKWREKLDSGLSMFDCSPGVTESPTRLVHTSSAMLPPMPSDANN